MTESKALKLEKINCSFCGLLRPCITSDLSGKSICYRCIQDAQEAATVQQVGSVKCLKCGKHDSITVEMSNNTIIKYVSTVNDENDSAVYLVSEFKGETCKNAVRKKATCNHCNTNIPLYILDRSDYIL